MLFLILLGLEKDMEYELIASPKTARMEYQASQPIIPIADKIIANKIAQPFGTFPFFANKVKNKVSDYSNEVHSSSCQSADKKIMQCKANGGCGMNYQNLLSGFNLIIYEA